MKKVPEQELIDLFQAPEGSVNFYYGRIGNGKTYAATADILDLLEQGRVVYANWKVQWQGFDERNAKLLGFFRFLLGRKRFYRFRPENLHYFSPDDVDIGWLGRLTDCDVFIDEGQWIFDSYEQTRFSKEKRRLILHTRHFNRSLNIISQRTQAIQISARGQVNRFFKCEKVGTWPWITFQRTEFQDMAGEDVDEMADPISVKKYRAKKKVFDAYNSKYMREGVPISQEVEFDAYDLTFWERFCVAFPIFRAASSPKNRSVDLSTWLSTQFPTVLWAINCIIGQRATGGGSDGAGEQFGTSSEKQQIASERSEDSMSPYLSSLHSHLDSVSSLESLDLVAEQNQLFPDEPPF